MVGGSLSAPSGFSIDSIPTLTISKNGQSFSDPIDFDSISNFKVSVLKVNYFSKLKLKISYSVKSDKTGTVTSYTKDLSRLIYSDRAINFNKIKLQKPAHDYGYSVLLQKKDGDNYINVQPTSTNLYQVKVGDKFRAIPSWIGTKNENTKPDGAEFASSISDYFGATREIDGIYEAVKPGTVIIDSLSNYTDQKNEYIGRPTSLNINIVK